MLRIKKTSIKIAALIGIVELLAMPVLFVALNYGITKILKNHAIRVAGRKCVQILLIESFKELFEPVGLRI